jgi:hypothetical protein
VIGSRTIFCRMPWSEWASIERDPIAVSYFIDNIRLDLAKNWRAYHLESETPKHWGMDPDSLALPRGEAVWLANLVCR